MSLKKKHRNNQREKREERQNEHYTSEMIWNAHSGKREWLAYKYVWRRLYYDGDHANFSSITVANKFFIKPQKASKIIDRVYNKFVEFKRRKNI